MLRQSPVVVWEPKSVPSAHIRHSVRAEQKVRHLLRTKGSGKTQAGRSAANNDNVVRLW